jgi:hypothetical protein
MSKVLFLDLEVTPCVGYTWERYEQNVLRMEKQTYILTVAYKWGSGHTKTLALPDYTAHFAKDHQSDKEIVKDIIKLLDKADWVVGHNLRNFDMKIIRQRELVHHLAPHCPVKILDTLTLSRRLFKSPWGHKLGDACTTLGIGSKLETGGFQTWLDCMAGDLKAFTKMRRYCKNDVELLYRFYKRIEPHIVANNIKYPQ